MNSVQCHKCFTQFKAKQFYMFSKLQQQILDQSVTATSTCETVTDSSCAVQATEVLEAAEKEGSDPCMSTVTNEVELGVETRSDAAKSENGGGEPCESQPVTEKQGSVH